jgi:hypothetical protein
VTTRRRVSAAYAPQSTEPGGWRGHDSYVMVLGAEELAMPHWCSVCQIFGPPTDCQCPLVPGIESKIRAVSSFSWRWTAT